MEIMNILKQKINFITVNNIKIKSGTFDIKLEKSINSNNKTYRLYNDDMLIKVRDTRINYTCPTCDRKWDILLKKFFTKKTLYCNSCKELDETKKTNHSIYMKNTFKENNMIKPKNIKPTKSKQTPFNYINESNNSFTKENKLFISEYYDKHITNEEFLKLKEKIYKVNGHLFDNNMVFFEHLKVSNQNKYSSYLYDSDNDLFINFNKIEYFCDNCDCTFKTSRLAKEKMTKHKVLCRTCSLCNDIFKIRHTHNIRNEKILYQSKPELSFINFCKDNNIYLQNGHNVDYVFLNKKRKYRIDFFIPKINTLLEIKDNHIWHKKQLESGKWQIKEASARTYAKHNGFKYELVFVGELEKFMKKIQHKFAT